MPSQNDSMHWPAKVVELRRLETLIPSVRNARTHSDSQVAQIANSMIEFGWTAPILIDEKCEVIAGHGRVMAAQMLGFRDVPVIVARGWTEEQKRAYRLADNKLALNGGWDEDMLALEISELKSLGFDVQLLGFSPAELAALAFEPPAGLTDPDDVPDVQSIAVSRPGDVWLLGKHRLICGDATSKQVVAKVLGGALPNLMITDPPYGVNYDPSWRNRAGVSRTGRTGKVMNDHRADWTEVWQLYPGDVAYVWHGALHAATVAASLTGCGFEIRSQIVWAKDRLVMGRGHYHWQHEPCWYAVRSGAKGHWKGDRKQNTLWSISGRDQDAETIHGTQKPVECMRRPIDNHSAPGDAVYEPFSGSGTTLIAAEMTKRRCLAIEIAPLYVDVAVRRWQAFVGQDAILESSDQTFDRVATERQEAA